MVCFVRDLADPTPSGNFISSLLSNSRAESQVSNFLSFSPPVQTVPSPEKILLNQVLIENCKSNFSRSKFCFDVKVLKSVYIVIKNLNMLATGRHYLLHDIHLVDFFLK